MKFKTLKRINHLLAWDVAEREEKYEQAQENYRYKKNQMSSDWDSDDELEYLKKISNEALDKLNEAKAILEDFENHDFS